MQITLQVPGWAKANALDVLKQILGKKLLPSLDSIPMGSIIKAELLPRVGDNPTKKTKYLWRKSP